MLKKRLRIGFLASALLTTAVGVAIARPVEAATERVLVLAGTVSGGTSSIEASQATADGFDVDVVDGATWSTMTAAQFASYRAIILGDPTCAGLTPDIQAAVDNAATWGSVINGNVLITGTDPVYHAGQGGERLTRQAIDFAVAQPGKTGAYISLSCYYHGAAPNTPVPLLDGIASGGFAVSGVGCYNNVHIVAESPALAGLDDSTLSNWSCSVHEAFSTWPGALVPLAIARDFDSSYTASDGTQGPPFILAGGDIRSFPLSLSPLSASRAAGGSHTVTAQLLDGVTRLPVLGASIRFRITAGPNSGRSGGCLPVTCHTDSFGHVSFSYASNGSTGTDTIQAYYDANGNSVVDAGEPQTTAGITWTRPANLKYVALGDSFSAGEGIEPFFEPKNRCHRSTSAYPTLVELPGSDDTFFDKKGTSGTEWGFQACSGAWTYDVLYNPKWSDPIPQLQPDRTLDTGNANDLPVDAATDLVTITVGGNNVNFSEILSFCFWSNDCTTEKYKGTSLAQYNRNRRDALSPQLDEVYRKIHEQAPSARILVLGYPQLLPATADEQNCSKLRQVNRLVRNSLGGYSLKSTGFSQTEQNYLRQATSELNQLIAARVENAHSNVTFVPVDTYFSGHEICGNDGEWINAASLRAPFRQGEIFGVNDQSFHPNADGQRYGYAEAINDWLNGLPEF